MHNTRDKEITLAFIEYRLKSTLIPHKEGPFETGNSSLYNAKLRIEGLYKDDLVYKPRVVTEKVPNPHYIDPSIEINNKKMQQQQKDLKEQQEKMQMEMKKMSKQSSSSNNHKASSSSDLSKVTFWSKLMIICILTFAAMICCLIYFGEVEGKKYATWALYGGFIWLGLLIVNWIYENIVKVLIILGAIGVIIGGFFIYEMLNDTPTSLSKQENSKAPTQTKLGTKQEH